MSETMVITAYGKKGKYCTWYKSNALVSPMIVHLSYFMIYSGTRYVMALLCESVSTTMESQRDAIHERKGSMANRKTMFSKGHK